MYYHREREREGDMHTSKQHVYNNKLTPTDPSLGKTILQTKKIKRKIFRQDISNEGISYAHIRKRARERERNSPAVKII